MMKELYFAWYAMKKNIKSSAELRTSFLMNVIGMALNNTSFIIVWVFFVKSVGVIGGWTAFDIIALQGFTSICFGLVLSVGDGIRRLSASVASGSFDRFMLSPKNLLVRIATSSFGASAVGDVVFGITCLVIYAFFIHASILQILLIIFSIIISTTVFLSIGIVVYSMSFYFTDPDAVTYGLFQLFFTPAMFHGGAFQGVMRFVFTFFVPSLLIGTLPVEIVRDVSIEKFLLISILAIIWFIFSITIFNRAVKNYESSNFMTFGN